MPQKTQEQVLAMLILRNDKKIKKNIDKLFSFC